jgi:glycosyltransferase involved in cell wall biosynthesis
MKDKISVIIPIYNVEPYLRKCLDSVIKQTFTNLEILLINDGSPDNCGNICDEYAIKDKRIRVFHKKNGGLSSALNVGLENFTGDYLGFVDPDDWVEPDMFEVLYTAIKEFDVQVSVCGYFKTTTDRSLPVSNKKQIPQAIIKTKELLLYPLQRDDYMGFCGYVCNKLYLAKTVRESGIRFANEIKYGMDSIFYMTLVLEQNCQGIYTDRPLYRYLQRETAISKSESYDIKFDILEVYRRIEMLLNENGYSDISYWARGFYCYHAGVIAEIAYKNGDGKTLRLMQDEIRKYLRDYEKTNLDYPHKCRRMPGLLDLEVNRN